MLTRNERVPSAEAQTREQPAPASGSGRRWLRIALPILATVVVLAPVAWLWQHSRVPSVYSVMDMGTPDYGGGPHLDMSTGHHDMRMVSVTDLVADPRRPADTKIELVARQENLTVGGRRVAGYTLNGSSPGPLIRLRQGDLVQIHVRNESVAAGIALHWHGLDLPNAMDGVAGVTQDSVAVGQDFTYRFVANQVGTFWYHSHQLSNAQVTGGLLGPLVVVPRAGDRLADVDVPIVSHTYNGVRTLNGQPADLHVPARAGQRVRLRVINTDNGPIETWASAAYRLAAVDGTDLHDPGLVRNEAVTVTAGGRADLALTMPPDGSAVRVQVSKAVAVVLGAPGVDAPAPPEPPQNLDLLHYGTPTKLPFDPRQANRSFQYRIGHQAGFVRGRPGLWWSINGALYPHVPMYVVREGDIVRMHIENHSGEVHPMHLHGHHAVVLARNGQPSTGSPWWVDSLNVLDDESYDIAFRADNPGIWMDHCHNLKHAAQGMVAHLMYENVSTPFLIGGDTANVPE